MITIFKLYEELIHAEIDPYEEEIWDEEYISIKDYRKYHICGR